MKVGDMVRCTPDVYDNESAVGIIIEIIPSSSVPPVCMIMYSSGDLEKEWTDELEVIND